MSRRPNGALLLRVGRLPEPWLNMDVLNIHIGARLVPGTQRLGEQPVAPGHTFHTPLGRIPLDIIAGIGNVAGVPQHDHPHLPATMALMENWGTAFFLELQEALLGRAREFVHPRLHFHVRRQMWHATLSGAALGLNAAHALILERRVTAATEPSIIVLMHPAQAQVFDANDAGTQRLVDMTRWIMGWLLPALAEFHGWIIYVPRIDNPSVEEQPWLQWVAWPNMVARGYSPDEHTVGAWYYLPQRPSFYAATLRALPAAPL